MENDLSTDLESAYDLIYATGVERGRWREQGEKRGDFQVIPGEAGTHHGPPSHNILDRARSTGSSEESVSSATSKLKMVGSTRIDCPGAAPAPRTRGSLCSSIFHDPGRSHGQGGARRVKLDQLPSSMFNSRGVEGVSRRNSRDSSSCTPLMRDAHAFTDPIPSRPRELANGQMAVWIMPDQLSNPSFV